MPAIRVGSVMLLALAAFHFASCCYAQTGSALEKAKAQFDQERSRLKQKMQSDFEAVSDRISKSKESAEKKLARLDVVKNEKERFAKSNLIPWSAMMLPYSEAYITQLQIAQGKAIDAYNAQIDKHLKKKDESTVASLRAELKSILGIEVVARWNHSVNHGSSKLVEFYSNGRIGDVQSRATWHVQGVRLILRSPPQANAPGGIWIDNCSLSGDGLTYAGQNQSRMHIAGTYIHPKE